jgi:hypothetical protein
MKDNNERRTTGVVSTLKEHLDQCIEVLKESVKKKGSLCDPDVVRHSQKLDHIIVNIQLLKTKS